MKKVLKESLRTRTRINIPVMIMHQENFLVMTTSKIILPPPLVCSLVKSVKKPLNIPEVSNKSTVVSELFIAPTNR